MVADAEPVGDEPGHAAGGPQGGGEAEGGGRLAQAGQGLEALVVGQPGPAAGVGPGLEAGGAGGAVGGDPAADGALRDAEEGGDIFLEPPLLDPLDGEAAALL